MCYTSGTTGTPRGSSTRTARRSCTRWRTPRRSSIGMTERDRLLVIVPMFHANAWGTPYSCWMVGADLVHARSPSSRASGPPDHRGPAASRCPAACRRCGTTSCERSATPRRRPQLAALGDRGGSAVPRALIEALRQPGRAPTSIQGWGMTETSPLAAFGLPPAALCRPRRRSSTGVKAGPHRARRRGPGGRPRTARCCPTTASRSGSSRSAAPGSPPPITRTTTRQRFHDGWLRTGDVGSLDDRGYMTISDRTKDVIKSGGEWISSVELEGLVMGHPDVFEAAVIAVPDQRWDERPLVCVVPRRGRISDRGASCSDFLAGKVARWALPERWTFIDTVPKTSVGKFDKKVLRARPRRRRAAGHHARATTGLIRPANRWPSWPAASARWPRSWPTSPSTVCSTQPNAGGDPAKGGRGAPADQGRPGARKGRVRARGLGSTGRVTADQPRRPGLAVAFALGTLLGGDAGPPQRRTRHRAPPRVPS